MKIRNLLVQGIRLVLGSKLLNQLLAELIRIKLRAHTLLQLCQEILHLRLHLLIESAILVLKTTILAAHLLNRRGEIYRLRRKPTRGQDARLRAVATGIDRASHQVIHDPGIRADGGRRSSGSTALHQTSIGVHGIIGTKETANPASTGRGD